MRSLMTRAWVGVDLGALLQNARAVQVAAGVPLLPMIKADAYGLGALRVAHALESLDPWGFGVATVEEGMELRHAGFKRPIVVFTPLLGYDFDAARRADLRPSLGSIDAVHRWNGNGAWHLPVDTGMSRSGVKWSEVSAMREVLERWPPEGAFTHFHSAEREDGSRDEQERRFEHALSQMPVRPPLVHAENSSALENRQPSRYTLARPGIFLYGVSTGEKSTMQPAPVASLHARVVEVRSLAVGDSVSYDATWRAERASRIATVAVGYGDGYRRALSNCGVALLRDQRIRVVGNVTMDMTMLDVTDVDCSMGDVVTLLGVDAREVLTVADVARAGGLSPYELLTGLRGRLPRRFRDADDDDSPETA
ncbi:MAG: Alanine racemase [Gemmatimonadetes bacterium]|nr:Alanine racemase [Gemmatimonadota bacterium]